MRRWLAPLLLLLLGLVALGTSRSILKARLLELRIAIQRDQILRYELSSRLLRYRFKQMLEDRDNVRGEIKLSVLESHVVNDLSQGMPEPGFVEQTGAFLINAVRFISFKPSLNILEKRVKVLYLHAGFFYERNRNCPAAIKSYASFDTGEDSPDSAFVLLHSGYCMAVTGKLDDAITTLETVTRRFPGTHFQRSADEILELLRGMRETAKVAATQSDDEAADTLFRAGQFSQVDRLLSKKPVSGRQKYMLGRSKEETGQIPEAVAIYRELAASGDVESGKLANRRLLLMGTIYNQGPEIAKEAEERAVRTGDAALVQETTQAVQEQKPAEVLKAEVKAEIQAAPEAKVLQDLRTEIAQREAAIQISVREEPPPGLEVILSDGRKLPGISILMEDDRAILTSARPVAIPSVLIVSIQLAQTRPEYRVCAVDKPRHQICGSSLKVTNAVISGEGSEMQLQAVEAILVQKGVL